MNKGHSDSGNMADRAPKDLFTEEQLKSESYII